MTERELMMTPGYAAVLSDPGCDAPRESLAAWLEDRWSARTELIRLQVADGRAARRALKEGRRDTSLWNAGADLLDHLRESIDAPLRSLSWMIDWDFVRGFVSLVEMDCRCFLDRADELFSLFPVRHLVLRDCGELIVELAASSYLQRLVGLSMRQQNLGDAEVLVLAESPHIRNLRWLNLFGNRIGLDGFEALAWSPNLPDLVHVNLYSNAAPNPTAELGHDWTGAAVCLDRVPATSEELERKYGYKRWLHGAELIPHYPPSYDAFDGDDPV